MRYPAHHGAHVITVIVVGGDQRILEISYLLCCHRPALLLVVVFYLLLIISKACANVPTIRKIIKTKNQKEVLSQVGIAKTDVKIYFIAKIHRTNTGIYSQRVENILQ